MSHNSWEHNFFFGNILKFYFLWWIDFQCTMTNNWFIIQLTLYVACCHFDLLPVVSVPNTRWFPRYIVSSHRAAGKIASIRSREWGWNHGVRRWIGCPTSPGCSSNGWFLEQHLKFTWKYKFINRKYICMHYKYTTSLWGQNQHASGRGLPM